MFFMEAWRRNRDQGSRSQRLSGALSPLNVAFETGKSDLWASSLVSQGSWCPCHFLPSSLGLHLPLVRPHCEGPPPPKKNLNPNPDTNYNPNPTIPPGPGPEPEKKWNPNSNPNPGRQADLEPCTWDCMKRATTASVQYSTLVVSSQDLSLAIWCPTVLSSSSIRRFPLTRWHNCRANSRLGWAQTVSLGLVAPIAWVQWDSAKGNTVDFPVPVGPWTATILRDWVLMMAITALWFSSSGHNGGGGAGAHLLLESSKKKKTILHESLIQRGVHKEFLSQPSWQ